MNENQQVNPLSEEELKRVKEHEDTLKAKIIKAKNMLRPGAIDQAETEAVEKEDYEFAAKLRDLKNQD